MGSQSNASSERSLRHSSGCGPIPFGPVTIHGLNRRNRVDGSPPGNARCPFDGVSRILPAAGFSSIRFGASCGQPFRRTSNKGISSAKKLFRAGPERGRHELPKCSRSRFQQHTLPQRARDEKRNKRKPVICALQRRPGFRTVKRRQPERRWSQWRWSQWKRSRWGRSQ